MVVVGVVGSTEVKVGETFVVGTVGRKGCCGGGGGGVRLQKMWVPVIRCWCKGSVDSTAGTVNTVPLSE